ETAATAAATRFANGTLARTSYGNLAVAIDKAKAKVETLSTVDRRLGFRTWQWRLDTRLEGRVADSGWVGFFDRTSNRLQSVSIPPVQIFDAHGHDVTPKGTHWGLVTTSGQQYLTLSLDDSGLPLPYTIDPGAYRTNATVSSTNASGTFTLTTPATVNAEDLLLVHEAGKATAATATFPALPTDNSGGNAWAQVAGTNVANVTIDQFVWWKWAVSADGGKTVTVTIPSSTTPSVTTAVVDVYKGLDSTQASPQTTGATNTGTGSRKFTSPAITPSGATTQEHMIMMVSGTFATSTAWSATVIATGGTWAVQSSGTNIGSASAQSMATYDSVTSANTAYAATASGNVWGATTSSVTSAFGFSDDVTNPANSITATNVTGGVYLAAASGATGTLYYKGDAAGSFQLQ